MIGRAILGLCAIALAGGTAAAGEPSSKSGARNDPHKIVCRTERDTGSRLGKSKVCKTNAEWAELRRQTKETIDHIQGSRAMNSD